MHVKATFTISFVGTFSIEGKTHWSQWKCLSLQVLVIHMTMINIFLYSMVIQYIAKF